MVLMANAKEGQDKPIPIPHGINNAAIDHFQIFLRYS
jgi:hypothetical protein